MEGWYGSWLIISNRSGWNTGFGAVSGFETQRQRGTGIFDKFCRASSGAVLADSIHIRAVFNHSEAIGFFVDKEV